MWSPSNNEGIIGRWGEKVNVVKRLQPALQSLCDRGVLRFILQTPRISQSKDGRCIQLNSQSKPLIDERTKKPCMDNTVHSNRYTIWDFLPRQLFFQFSKLANLYLLIIAFLQFIPGLSPTSNYTGIIPLLVMVSISMAREGYDDFRRHKLDKVENNKETRRLIFESCGSTNHGSAGGRGLRKRFFPNKSNPLHRDPQEDRSERLLNSTSIERRAWESLKWKDVKVGDIIKLRRDEDVPADILLLYADSPNGIAYAETAALDGETNLKWKQPCPILAKTCGTLDGLSKCSAQVVVEDPNLDLYNFKGRVEMNGKLSPLTMNEMMLRGSTLKNTSNVIGVVVNTGEECKIRLNAEQKIRPKAPELQKAVNRVVIFVVVFVILLVLSCTIAYQFWTASVENYAWYLNGAHITLAYTATANLLLLNTFIPLALYVSLEIVKVGQVWQQSQDIHMYDPASDNPMKCNTATILEDLGQVGYVFSDKTGTLTQNIMHFRKISIGGHMWLHDTDVDKAKEEAGKKTAGSSLSTIPERSSARPDDLQSVLRTTELLRYMNAKPDSIYTKKANLFLIAIALCHTCLPEVQDGEIEYQAASPDELALVRAAQELGFLVIDRTTNSITLSLSNTSDPPKIERYSILDVIEFSAERRRMAIIVRFPNGKVCLICKGADSAMIPRLKHNSVVQAQAVEVTRRSSIQRSLEAEEIRRKGSIHQSPSMASPGLPSISDGIELWPLTSRPSTTKPATHFEEFYPMLDDAPLDEATVYERSFEHLNNFALEGLRTLVFGHRFLDTQEYNDWKKLYATATTCLIDRQTEIERVSDSIEQNLTLTGITAIEDKLQDGCAQTIEKMHKANIKVWMLTGDKRETAINIGYSTRICKSYSEIVILDYETKVIERQLAEAISGISKQPHMVVVLDGQTLTEVDADETLVALFFELVVLADSVICCRASPSQKASLVRRIRIKEKSVTLAIGDGANDIAMIAEAHVGIGISGKEGLQAVRSSDFSIAQFRFLQRLLFVHGHWNYDRTAKFTLCTLWKETAFFLMQAWYQGLNGYTSTSFFDSPALTVFNTLFSSLCVIILGIVEQDLSAATLLARPELYAHGQRGRGFSFTKYLAWASLGVMESILTFWLVYAIYGSAMITVDNGVYAMGDICLGVSIILINTKILLIEMHNKTWVVAVSWAITVVGWFAFNIFSSAVTQPHDSRTYNIRRNFLDHIGRDLGWWATFIAVLTSVFVLELAVLGMKKAFWPSDIEVFQELQKDKSFQTLLEKAVEKESETDVVVQEGMKELNKEEELEAWLGKDKDFGRKKESSGAQRSSPCGGILRMRKKSGKTSQ